MIDLSSPDQAVGITHSHPIPLLATADVVVIQGTLAGCAAAYSAARAGCRVIVATSGCSVPHDLVVTRYQWVSDSELASLPTELRGTITPCLEGDPIPGGIRLINLSQVAIAIEDLLLDAGVRLFYGMTPCGVMWDDERNVVGAVLGGKCGLQGIQAGSFIDCTPTATIAVLAGADVAPISSDGHVIVSLCGRVNTYAQSDTQDPGADEKRLNTSETWPGIETIDVDGVPELVDGQIRVFGPNALFRFRLPVDPSRPLWTCRLSTRARELLITIGHTVTGARRRAGDIPLMFHRFGGDLIHESVVTASGHIPENIFTCASAAGPWATVTHALALGGALPAGAPGASIADITFTASEHSADETRHRFSCQDAPPLHNVDIIELRDSILPVIATTDVLVAGCGTSGVPAALSARATGCKVITTEQISDVGGTNTTGGVGAYWLGRETPYQRSLDHSWARTSHATGMARETSMMNSLETAGVQVLAPCVTVGILHSDARVTAAVVATENGLGLILATIIVDATGDADLAAWAGAPYTYGNGRDAWTLWGSFGNFNRVRRPASRQYESSMEVRDPNDFARSVVRGRRRQGMWRRHAHDMPQLYSTPRESRRLDGRATVTYGGILRGERFSDLIGICRSNFDIKGISSSDLLSCGVVWSWRVRYQYDAAVPFRALLPQGLENVIVCGRAYSVSHDAQSLARMQRDMMAIGGAAGHAAAVAATSGRAPSTLDVTGLQAHWLQAGMLVADDLTTWAHEPVAYGTADAEADLARLLRAPLPEAGAAETADASWDKALASVAEDELTAVQRLARLASSTVSIQPLYDAFTRAEEGQAKTDIARVLCYLGDSRTVDYLLAKIERQIADGLPHPNKRTLAVPPEHGWAPEPVYSIYAIGLTDAGERLAPLLQQVACLIPDDREIYTSKHESPFEYVRVITAAAERHPGPAMLTALHELARRESLRGYSLSLTATGRDTLLPEGERLAYLELCVARALARCGDSAGYDTLRTYTGDIRGTLARSAADELCALPASGARQPIPYTSRIH